MATPNEVASWISALPQTFDVQACTVTIAGTSYPAASYRETIKLDPSCDAYRRGEREHTREMIYAADMLPKCYCDSSHKSFKVADDAREWYIAGYFGNVKSRKQEVAAPSEFHPFGNSFMMAPWDINGSIDQYERVPYQRRIMTVVKES